MRTSGQRSTEIYEPAQWLVSPIGGDQAPEPSEDVYKTTLEFIEQRIRRGKAGYTIELDDGEIVGLGKFLAGSSFWDRWDLSDPEKLSKNMAEIRSIIDRFIQAPDPKDTAPVKNPLLFDDDFMEQSTQSIAEAPDVETTHGAFVTLSARASSITAVMNAFSAANSAKHIKTENEDNDSTFRRSYESQEKGLAGKVARGMGHSAGRMTNAISAHLNILNNSAGLQQAGFSVGEIQDIRGEMKDEIFERFSGTGQDIVKKRHQEIAKVIKAAEIARLVQNSKRSASGDNVV